MVHRDYRNIKGNVAAKKFYRGNPMPITLQARLLKQMIPESEVLLSKSALVWVGFVQPTAMSCKYKIQIEYDIETYPRVFVLDPPLKSINEDEPIPHMYEQERLCLYFPSADEWNNTKPLSKTILPWAVLWLMYYEYWHVTGSWEGGGIHLDDGETEATSNN